MDSCAHACVQIVTRHVKWTRLLNPSKVGETLSVVAGTNVRVSDLCSSVVLVECSDQ